VNSSHNCCLREVHARSAMSPRPDLRPSIPLVSLTFSKGQREHCTHAQRRSPGRLRVSCQALERCREHLLGIGDPACQAGNLGGEPTRLIAAGA